MRHFSRVSAAGMRWKTVVESDAYHMVVDHMGEGSRLVDMSNDSSRKSNVWSDARYGKVRFDLLKQCFDDVVLAIDTGPRRVGRY